MGWRTLDRIKAPFDPESAPQLDDALKNKIRSFFPRYETKRAVLLPALHIVQHAFGHVSHQAMTEIAELLEIHPSDVLDVVSFYTHFSARPQGRKTIVVCRSLSCELMGGKALLEALQEALGVGEHGTTPDGAYTLMTEECLAACEHAPCMLIGEKMHKKVRCEDLPALLADADNDVLSIPRSDLFDPPAGHHAEAGSAGAEVSGAPQSQ